MADDEFNINELISGADELVEDEMQSNTRNSNNTSNTSTTDNIDTSLHPFSVRLGQEYVDMIKALAWWKRISQREFIENIFKEYLKTTDTEKLSKILNKYRKSDN